MAEWGKYLKSAVANVEQQLDKVLLENQPGDLPRASTPRSEPAKPAGRRDLAERLRQAASGRGSSEEERRSFDSSRTEVSQSPSVCETKTPDAKLETEGEGGETSEPSISETTNNQNNDPVELLTLESFATAPDLGTVLTKARQLALAVQQDNTLELVDELESTQSHLNTYIENVTARLLSLNSKIAVLSRDKISQSSQSEKQVALLMEEGHRLSKRELELNLTVKKLRSDRNAALALGDKATAKDKQIEQLTLSVEQLKAKLKEHEALVEHYRFLAEGSSGGGHNSSDIHSAADDTKEHSEEQGATKNDTKFEVANRHFQEERKKWHELESDLLSRIAELEQNEEARSQNTAQLQRRLNEAQSLAKSSRDHANSLLEELDTVRENSQQTETRLKAQINELTTELMLQKRENTQKQSAVNDAKEGSPFDKPAEAAEIAEKEEEEEESNVSERRVSSSELTPEIGTPPSPLLPPPLPRVDSELQSPRTGSMLSKRQSFSGISLSQLDQVAVGPDGPFGGTLSESYDPNQSRNLDDGLSAAVAHSSEIIEDSFSNLSLPRRESSMQGSELLQGSQLHLVRKMTLSMRRLENELSSAQKIAEISKSERDEAQAELARLVDVQENMQHLEQAYHTLQESYNDLQKQYDECKVSMTDKDERIEELDADVRDLKEVYRDQIEALINEIETLKR